MLSDKFMCECIRETITKWNFFSDHTHIYTHTERDFMRCVNNSKQEKETKNRNNVWVLSQQQPRFMCGSNDVHFTAMECAQFNRNAER